MRALARFVVSCLCAAALAGCSSSEPVATPEVRPAESATQRGEVQKPAKAVESAAVENDAASRSFVHEETTAGVEPTLGFPAPIEAIAEVETAPAPPKPFSPEDGSFQVTFPLAPEVTTETLQDGGKLATYRATAGGVERVVNAYDLTESMDRETAEATLEAVVASIVESARGEATRQELVAAEDVATMRYDYVYEADGERFRTAGVMAIVGKRQFQASILAMEPEWDAAAAEAFLASFRPTIEAPLTAARSAEAGSPIQTPAPAAEPSGADVAATGVEKKLPWTDASVRFPAEPDVVSDDALAETDRVYHAFDGALSFSVTLHRDEEALPVEVAREALAATAEAIAGSVEGTTLESEGTPNERFAEHRLAYEYVGEDSSIVLVRQRLIYVGATQVYLIVAGPAADFDEDAANRFLDSWNLADAVAEGAADESR